MFPVQHTLQYKIWSELYYSHTVTTHFSQEMQIENKKYSFNCYQQYHMLISVVPVYVGIQCISIIP